MQLIKCNGAPILSTIVMFVATFLVAILVLAPQPATMQPVGIAYDVENIRDLYEILLKQQQEANAIAAANNDRVAASSPIASALTGSGTGHGTSMFVHQMERKGGRSPTLRLRFGRRSDPLWSRNGPMTFQQPSLTVTDEQ